jgi:hypothetical protein
VPVADIYTFLNEAYSAAAYFIPFWRPAKGLRTPAKAFTCGNPRKSLLVLFALFQLASHSSRNSQIQQQQQTTDSFCCFLEQLQNISLVVMMSAVSMWKPKQLVSIQSHTLQHDCAAIVLIAENSRQARQDS